MMIETYNHKEVERKWQEKWKKDNIFQTKKIEDNQKKAYILDMFPYPSGSGLHVGHLEGYSGSDVLSRFARKQGKNVLHPMGWDAFGLPAENFAIKNGVHPDKSTNKNVAEFKRQMNAGGLSYDWSREINTSKPEYYKWTQWLFGILYKRGLAYKKMGLVNWCPGCQTVLANEQAAGGECERCGSKVIQKELNQWYFKITDYAERLLNDLDSLDWPDKIKAMQRNWIGKSEGALIDFKVDNQEQIIRIFTTRADTLPGATFIVLSPENSLVDEITPPSHISAVQKYKIEAARKTELERTFLDREKSGVFTGAYAINPINKQLIPIWIADYVLNTYGTGAIMAVPAHDERDFAFAKTFGLDIIQVIGENNAPLPYLEKGKVTISGKYCGLDSTQAAENIIKDVEGQKKITYRLRDWLVSRQRYWGCPIPVVYDQSGKEYLLSNEELPVELPMDVEFKPSGQSPLTYIESWKNYHNIKLNKDVTREVDTLDTFICSSWYFLRYTSPNNSEKAFNSSEVNKWLPVDVYIGGAEHAVLHLLYARFITKVLFDEGLINFEEPFKKLINQGMILGPDHNKMSKSKGNVINPDDIFSEYGADTSRMYPLFMGPFEQEKPWNTKSVIGIRRFIEKIWKIQEIVQDRPDTKEESFKINELIKKISNDIIATKFNTAIAAMMEYVNFVNKVGSISKESYLKFISIINPFVPHISEELWEIMGQKGYCSLAPIPATEDVEMLISEITYPIQINNKIRAKVTAPADLSEKELISRVKSDPNVLKYLTGNDIIKEIIVPKKLISLVIAEKK